MREPEQPTRLAVWRDVSHIGWVIVAGVVGIVGSAPIWLGLFAPPEFVVALTGWLPRWPWYVYTIAALLILYISTVEGAYRLVARKFVEFDLARARVIDENLELHKQVAVLGERVANRVKSQAICEAMRARHREGISTLLHRGVSSQDEYEEWMADERRFLDGVLADMRRLGCSAGEIHSVEVIGVFPLGNYSPHVAANGAMSMFVVRLDRIADVATAHDTARVS